MGSWTALGNTHSLLVTGAIDRHKHTATSNGGLNLVVEAAAVKGFYKATFRVPGANSGTP